jgi:hypothetical protein
VEDCEALDANRWMREGILAGGVRRLGRWRWVYHGGRENSIGYDVETLDPDRQFVRLFYTVTQRATQEKEALDYRVRLTTTRPRFGGLRWWFICPLVVSGRACGRRVGKLYLPPGSRFFGCRACHGLTYHSAQTHDSRVSRLRRDPELLAAILDDLKGASVRDLILAMKAIG